MPSVRLVHMDDLIPRAAGSGNVLNHAMAIVEGELTRLRQWQRSRRHIPAIRKLVELHSAMPNADARTARKRLHERLLVFRQEVAA